MVYRKKSFLNAMFCESLDDFDIFCRHCMKRIIFFNHTTITRSRCKDECVFSSFCPNEMLLHFRSVFDMSSKRCENIIVDRDCYTPNLDLITPAMLKDAKEYDPNYNLAAQIAELTETFKNDEDPFHLTICITCGSSFKTVEEAGVV